MPAAVSGWVGRVFMFIFGFILLYLGKCCAGRKNSGSKKKYREILASEVVSEGPDYKVTVAKAVFSESFEIQSQCTIIRHDDYLFFHNPIHVEPSFYKNFDDDDVKRVIINMAGKLHHMAANIILEAFPDAIVTGSIAADQRHDYPDRYTASPFVSGTTLDLKGISFHDMQVPVYYECWAVFEPAKLLMVSDYIPNILSRNATNGFALLDCLIVATHCMEELQCCVPQLKTTSMAGYTMATCGDRESIRKNILNLFQTHKIEMASGSHPYITGPTFPREELNRMWAWLVPEIESSMNIDSPLIVSKEEVKVDIARE